MAPPANIRVNVAAPFPALVKAAGLITVGKAAGIWTIGFSIAQLGVEIPAIPNYPTDYLLVFDAVAGNFFKLPLSSLPQVGRTQRSVIAGPVAITAADQILNLNLPASLVITLPSYVTRLGVPLTFKDWSKATGAPFFAQTIAAAAGEKIDGLASVPLNVAGQEITITPANDGVNTGWAMS